VTTVGLRIAGVIAILVALSSSVGAQWPSYPTPDVPRTADGKPILEAVHEAHSIAPGVEGGSGATAAAVHAPRSAANGEETLT
jgi:hypothetical protein